MVSPSPQATFVDLYFARLSLDDKQKCIADFLDRLCASSQECLDLDSIETCLQLLQLDPDEVQLNRLSELVVREIEHEHSDLERLCKIAQICQKHDRLAPKILHYVEEVSIRTLFLLLETREREFAAPTRGFLETYLPNYSHTQKPASEDDIDSLFLKLSRCMAYTKALFWTVSNGDLLVGPTIITYLLAFLGVTQDVAAIAHDVLSAFLPLLGNDSIEFPLLPKIQNIDEQIWTRLREVLASVSSLENSGTTFRLWFQWAYQTGQYSPSSSPFQDDQYWTLLQSGLLQGFAEQRKYCLGILRQSLTLASETIITKHMTFDAEKSPLYKREYEKYCTLFETLVIDRYPNQVAACRKDLSGMLSHSSLVHGSWMMTMLSAALNSKIQEGIRKIVGYWYFDFAIKERESLDGQQNFLVHGFLPWATQGFLFTTSLEAGRVSTTCRHGNALSSIIQQFLQAGQNGTQKTQLFTMILQYVLDRGPRIFPYSILYLLEGLLQGLKSTSSLGVLSMNELELVLQISRRPGLAEIAKDLLLTYCMQFFEETPIETRHSIPGYNTLEKAWGDITTTETNTTESKGFEALIIALNSGRKHFLHSIAKALESDYKLLEGQALLQCCHYLSNALDTVEIKDISLKAIITILEAIWDETDTRQYPRAVIELLPTLFFHPTCVQMSIQSGPEDNANIREVLANLLGRVLKDLHHFARGRIYLFSSLAESIRQACFLHPKILQVLAIDDFLTSIANDPPVPREEFLFEVAAAEKLQAYVSHRTYCSYYGKREWHAYACIIDLLNRFPEEQITVAKHIFEGLLHPWHTQKPPIPIISKWKEAFQLQVILVLSESCMDFDVEAYLQHSMAALFMEPWPRYRYLLEWIIARIYHRHPELRQRLLPDLSNAGDYDPRLVASLMKLAVMVASFPTDSPDFTHQLMTQLIPFSASPKIQIRHEAHWSFPIVWDIAEHNEWRVILDNPAFQALNTHIRGLEKFKAPAASSRMLKLDSMKDHNLVSIFTGDYMRMDQSDREFVAYEDFLRLWSEDELSRLKAPAARIPLGNPRSELTTAEATESSRLLEASNTSSAEVATPLQTKSGFNLSSLLPTSAFSSSQRPSTLILVASLIDNPTNLGGLSRISEIFGLEALYLRSLDVLNSKDFQSTAVTSHKHLPIKELKVPDTPSFLLNKKTEGYEVLCIEQTDRSFVLGEIDENEYYNGKFQGKLPKKCVLVLGSEREGVSKEILAVADRCVEIGQVGVTRSLNVQTAAGIVCWEWWREQGGKTR